MRRPTTVPDPPGAIATAATPAPADGGVLSRAAEAETDASMRLFELLVGAIALLAALGLAGVR